MVGWNGDFFHSCFEFSQTFTSVTITLWKLGRNYISFKATNVQKIFNISIELWCVGPFKQFDFCLTFCSPNLLNECWVHLNRSVTLSKVLKKVESLSNGSQIKFEFDQTFV